MSGLDKILEHITEEAKNEAEKIISAAENEAEKLISGNKEETQRQVALINRQAELDAAAAAKRITSAAALKEKRMILQAKQQCIEDVFSETRKYIANMGDEEYFELLKRMLARYAGKEKGVIALNEKDLKRLPADFKAETEKYNLTLSDIPAEIDGGFILSYGDIGENCSFDSLISDSREELQDKIGQILFG